MAETRSTVFSSRTLLIAAAVVAMSAIAVSIWRGQSGTPTPTPTGAVGGVSNATLPTDPAAAITQLEAALKTNPNDARGWRILGSAHRASGNFAESAMAYRRATALEPNNAEGWAALGEALALASPPPISAEARAALRTALEKDPNEPLAAYYLAVAKDMDGDHKGAIDDWFKLIERSPADAPWLGEVRGAISRVAAANNINVADRLKAVKSAPPRASVATGAIPGPTPEQMKAAQALPKGAQDAMVTEMVEGLAKKLEANPANVDGWIMLMRSRVTLGQTVQAQQALARAKAANPASAAKLDAAARELGM